MRYSSRWIYSGYQLFCRLLYRRVHVKSYFKHPSIDIYSHSKNIIRPCITGDLAAVRVIYAVVSLDIPYIYHGIEMALYAYHYHIARWLIAQCRTISGTFMCYCECSKMAKWMIQHDKTGNVLVKNAALLHVAVNGGHLGFVKWLIKNGADPQYQGNSPLKVAHQRGNKKIVGYLIDHGANPHEVYWFQ